MRCLFISSEAGEPLVTHRVVDKITESTLIPNSKFPQIRIAPSCLYPLQYFMYCTTYLYCHNIIYIKVSNSNP
jgi:hypothetical protein